MPHSRALALLVAAVSLLAVSSAHAAVGILPIADQDIPSGKTLVVPIPASDPGGPARSYTVTVGAPAVSTVSGTATITGSCGINATIRTGDPHFILGVSYTDSNSIAQTGTMEFQLLREFAPLTTQIITGLTEGGLYSPTTTGSDVTFYRIVVPPNNPTPFVIQGGPAGSGLSGPGFTFPNEFNKSLIFSGSAGQLCMANAGYGISGTNIVFTSTSSTNTGTSTLVTNASDGTNSSEFFITLSASNRTALDFGYNIFGQMLRGFDTLEGIAGTPLTLSGTVPTTSPVTPPNITSAVVTQNDTDAVLILSATGVCDAAITVTAISAGGSATATFTAHAVADTVNDPPFLQPVPDATARNGSSKVSLSGTDLQLDLLRYGYRHLLPFYDPGLTTGTSPVFTIPLVSNTDNVLEATVDQWNPVNSAHGFDTRIFHLAAGDKPITGSLAHKPAVNNRSLVNPVAIFTAGNPKDTAASFTASVNCGDGAYLSGTQVSIVKVGNRYELMAGHTYTTPGEYPLIVKVSDPGGAWLSLTGTTFIPSGSITISGKDFSNRGGRLVNHVVATFVDSGAASTPAGYTATIDWGDGSVSPGLVRNGSASSYEILGSHVYTSADTFTVSASVSRTSGSSAYEWSAAHIAGVKSPQIFPPFSQAHLAQIWSPLVSDSDNVINGAPSADGGNPVAPLIVGPDGYLYGTTLNGGDNDFGVVFKITTSGSYTTLYSFTGTDGDGANPATGLLSATDGFLYGTTKGGGSSNEGTIFKITTNGVPTTVYSFLGGVEGGTPIGTLIQGINGNFYGTTQFGGTNGLGVVYQLTSTGSYTELHAFNGTDGNQPLAGLVTGTDGKFYGTTSKSSSGQGTVYQITTSGSFRTIYGFDGGTNGGNPHAGLISGSDGNLYGTTENGGAGQGTIFKMTTGGAITTLYRFQGATDGGQPAATLLSASDGNLYGTTQEIVTSGTSFGTVFQMTYSGSLTTIHTFTNNSVEGSNPEAGLVTGTDGNLYGTTEDGGNNGGFGTVYEVATGTADTLIPIHAFTGGTTQTQTTSAVISLRGSVAIINSGNKPSSPGSFSAYVDAAAQPGTQQVLDGNQQIFTSGTTTAFPIPALKPGQYFILPFRLEGTAVDTRLKLPAGYDPTGQEILGVVIYSDPVANFDGSANIISLGAF